MVKVIFTPFLTQTVFNSKMTIMHIFTAIKNFGQHLFLISWKFIQTYPLKSAVIGAGGVVIVVMGVSFFGSADTPTTTEGLKTREVEIALVSDLARNAAPISLVGEVTSISEASVLSEAGGVVRGAYRKLGDYVPAGAVIAELENASQRASVEQAQAQVASARATLAISEISGTRDLDFLEEAKASVVNTLRSSYDSADDSIRTKIDQMFSNPEGETPQFTVTTSNSQLVTSVNNKRLIAKGILNKQTDRQINLSPSKNLLEEINKAEEEIRYLKNFIDDVAEALNQSLPSPSITQTTIETYKTTVATARTTLNTTLASLSSARDTLTSKESQYEITRRQSNTGEVAPSTSEAGLQLALGALRAAQVNLEKTIIRAPISGTLNSFSLKIGDYVSTLEDVAVISNNNALEVLAYVTEEEKRFITPGSKVTIEGIVPGVVSKVAPALDPKTKKVEVRIGIVGDSSKTITNGQSVRLSISRIEEKETETNSLITLPIAAIKVTPKGSVVFTINTENTLISHLVKEGSILGDKITILEGVTPDMAIVTDARGLKEGQRVLVK